MLQTLYNFPNPGHHIIIEEVDHANEFICAAKFSQNLPLTLPIYYIKLICEINNYAVKFFVSLQYLSWIGYAKKIIGNCVINKDIYEEVQVQENTFLNFPNKEDGLWRHLRISVVVYGFPRMFWKAL